MHPKSNRIHLALMMVGLLLGSLYGLYGCANVGSPEGGPYDVTPPRLIRSNPEQGAKGVSGQSFSLRFDEFIKLSAQEKIIVSPPQLQSPRITASGKSVYIRLEDSLKPNTTYSFYFDDAIVDNNEDNPLENFAYTFTTGQTLDTMQIAGTVLDAQTLEPVGELMIGGYLAQGFADSSFRVQTFPFASKTNKMGRFTMRGLKDSVYRLFALKDADNNYRFSLPNEGIAFSEQSYKTTCRDSIKTDTIRIDSIVRRDTLHRDSLVSYPHTFYYPDNVLLRYFEPKSQRMGIERTQRRDLYTCTIDFLSPIEQFPQTRLLESSSPKAYLTSASGSQLQYWLRDSALMHADSIRFEIKYPKTDSLLRVSTQTDTLTFYKPRTKEKSEKKGSDSIRFSLSLTKAMGIHSQTPGDSIGLLLSLPVDSFPERLIHLEATADSVYTPKPFVLIQDSLNKMAYHLKTDLPYGHKYKLHIDSATLHSIYGVPNEPVQAELMTLPENELGSLSVRLRGIGQHAVVQLLDKSDVVLMSLSAHEVALPKADSLRKPTPTTTQSPEQDPMLAQLLSTQAKATPSDKEKPSSTALTDSTTTKPTDSISKLYQVSFRDLKPDEYYLKLFVDTNQDGQWTTGNYPTTQPEMVYYCPTTFAIKKGFTTEEEWDVLALPLDKQKPEKLRKTKAEEKKKREDKNKEYYKRIKR